MILQPYQGKKLERDGHKLGRPMVLRVHNLLFESQPGKATAVKVFGANTLRPARQKEGGAKKIPNVTFADLPSV